MSILISIVDDKPINRQTVKDKLIDQLGIEIAFEAKNGIDFLEKLKLVPIKPDVV
jgi:chemotaxis response regulator CheB